MIYALIITIFAVGYFAGYMHGRNARLTTIEPRVEELEVRVGLRQKRSESAASTKGRNSNG